PPNEIRRGSQSTQVPTYLLQVRPVERVTELRAHAATVDVRQEVHDGVHGERFDRYALVSGLVLERVPGLVVELDLEPVAGLLLEREIRHLPGRPVSVAVAEVVQRRRTNGLGRRLVPPPRKTLKGVTAEFIQIQRNVFSHRAPSQGIVSPSAPHTALAQTVPPGPIGRGWADPKTLSPYRVSVLPPWALLKRPWSAPRTSRSASSPTARRSGACWLLSTRTRRRCRIGCGTSSF